MAKVSVVVVTKNEERNIRQCLESVQWADEIVVVDAFSSDRTVEICREFTDRVCQKEWTNYAEQKNYAIGLATYPWVLLVDADERVTEALKAEIKATLEAQQGISSYCIYSLEYMFGRWIRHGGWYTPHARLFLKDKVSYCRPVHEELTIKGKVSRLKNPLLHLSHLRISHFIQKLDSYTTMEADYHYRQGHRPSFFRLLCYPIGLFFCKFVWQRGFQDGMHGLIIALLYCGYRFIEQAKLWELWFLNSDKAVPPESQNYGSGL